MRLHDCTRNSGEKARGPNSFRAQRTQRHVGVRATTRYNNPHISYLVPTGSAIIYQITVITELMTLSLLSSSSSSLSSASCFVVRPLDDAVINSRHLSRLSSMIWETLNDSPVPSWLLSTPFFLSLLLSVLFPSSTFCCMTYEVKNRAKKKINQLFKNVHAVKCYQSHGTLTLIVIGQFLAAWEWSQVTWFMS